MRLSKNSKTPSQNVTPFQFAARLETEGIEASQASEVPTHQALQSVCRSVMTPDQDQVDSVAKEKHFIDRISELEDTLEKSKQALDDAKTVAYEDGVKAGKAAEERDHKQALEALQKAIAENSKTIETKLNDTMDTSVTIAQAILHRILGDQAALPEHVLQTAQHWRQELTGSAILQIRVSGEDFSDEEALARLEQQFAGVQVRVDPSLPMGACFFDLKLGSLDASISRQLENANAFIDQWRKSAGQS